MINPEIDFSFKDEVATSIATGILRRGEVLFGDFVLRSGAWSPMYVDLRTTSSAVENNSDAPTMSKSDQINFRNNIIMGYSSMADLLDGEFEHIQAVPEAVCGIAPMIAHERGESYLHRRIKFKDYGRPSEGILGNFNEGDRTLFIDDLISTSGAKIDEKILVEDISRPGKEGDSIRGVGLIVEHALILLDRETGGIEKAASQGLIIHAGITMSKVLDIGYAEGVISQRNYNIVKAYIRGDLKRKEDIHLFE